VNCYFFAGKGWKNQLVFCRRNCGNEGVLIVFHHDILPLLAGGAELDGGKWENK